MWKIAIFVLFELYAEISSKQVTGRYECGENGKFEYCLEGVPGCVIGCHCHPGFYFDTETKICEPYNRLAQNFRKQNTDDAVTRKQLDLNVYPTRVNSKEFTTIANINDKLNDDLGDWLYNQFFKTVENQVLNETSINPDTPSRRSGDPKNIVSRRSKNRKQKKNSKKRDRRRKLLKIPSDDPMWETSGESDSDSSSGSNSDKSASESKEKKRHGKEHWMGNYEKKKSDHDHSKFLMIKKQPKPPLPSFIFLPNVETPYYPSVGIAAAAAMPMYPMVPVPPMVPYPGPQPGALPIPGGIGGVSSTTEPSTTIIPTTVSPPAHDSEEEKKNVVDPNLDNPLRMGNRTRKLRKRGRLDKQHHVQHASELSRRHHKTTKPSLPLPIQTNFPVPTLNEGHNEPSIQIIQASSKPKQILQDADKLENIKYLSQLIHKTRGSHNENPVPLPKGDFNNIILQRIENQLKRLQDPKEEKHKRNNQLLKKISNHLSQILSTKKEDSEELKPSRRMFNHGEPNIADEGDAYYANLGRQIASVIKYAQPSGISDSTPLSPPVFNENNYSSRSFWERAVRSPTSHTILSELTTTQSLYELENKVKYAATDVPFLSLSEIENIINMVNGGNKQNDVEVHVSQTEHNSTRILNLDLFPKNSHKLIDIKDNNANISTALQPLIKYSIFKTVKNIVTTPKENTNEPQDKTQKSYQNKHHTGHHHHHHGHKHVMPDEPSSHHLHFNKENEKEQHFKQHETHNYFENIDKKIFKDLKTVTQNNYTINENVNPKNDDAVVDNIHDNLKNKLINEIKYNNSKSEPNNLGTRKVYANDDSYIDLINPRVNMNINQKANDKDGIYAYPNDNHHPTLTDNVYLYTNDNPSESSVGNDNTNENHIIEPIYSSFNPFLTNNQNGIPLAAQNMYRDNAYNVNSIPNEDSKLHSLFPNLNLEASNNNENPSNNHEIRLKTDINPIVNIEIPTNFKVNNSSHYTDRYDSKHIDEIPKIHNTRRNIVTNDTEKYSKSYTNLSYNIDHRRQPHAYPSPTIYKGKRPKNQNKPIWTGFRGQGLKAFKKQHTPIFHSALFFDDFN